MRDQSIGSSQPRRIKAELDPAYVLIEGKSLADLLDFASEYAKLIQYYDIDKRQDGDWQRFFSPSADIQPHHALWRAFLKLFQYPQAHLNRLTDKHLKFYFQKILQIPPKEAVADRLDLHFELKKKVARHLVKAGTALQAGKDDTGRPLIFRTEKDLVVNTATVADVKSVFVELKHDHRIYVRDISIITDPAKAEQSAVGFNLFGESQFQKPDHKRTMAAADLGWAIASRILLCREGSRTFTFTLSLAEPAADPLYLERAFIIYFSSRKGWIGPLTASGRVIDQQTFEIQVNLSRIQPGVEPFEDGEGGPLARSGLPLVKILLNPQTDDYPYRQLCELRIQSIGITVEVAGMRNLLLYNDQGRLDPVKPFMPFGPQPVLGSQFWVGNAEAFLKKLDYFSLALAWHELPGPDFETHYRAYSDEEIDNSAFTVRMRMLLDRSWNAVVKEQAFLFNLGDIFDDQTITINDPQAILAKENIAYNPDAIVEDFIEFKPDLRAGFVKLELTGPESPIKAFGHQQYPDLYTARVVQIAAGDNSVRLPQRPYTPTLKKIALSYRASTEIHFTSAARDQTGSILYRINPFGHLQLARNYRDLPYLVAQFYDEGHVFLGLRGLEPPATITIYCKAVEGSADTERRIRPQDLRWYYLAGEEWIEMNAYQRVSDTTRNIQGSGILTFSLPAAATREHTLMPSGMHWICASLKDNIEGTVDVVTLRTQVVSARFENQGNSLTHLEHPLPALSVQKLARNDPAVKLVEQPYASYGGRAPESDRWYYTRVSERLRHKQRALTVWDFEHLVLEAFPSIYQVKCIAGYNGTSGQAEAGAVTVVVVPDMRNIDLGNRLEPRAGSKLLEDIQQYLAERISLFLNLSVQNPVYEQILVHAKVRFNPGIDEGYYVQVLNEEIKRFLSPWAFDEGLELVFGGRIHQSEVIAFIERRPYVDYITNFRLSHITKNIGAIGIGSMEVGLDFVVGDEVVQAVAASPRSIIVSVQQHDIQVWREEENIFFGTRELGIDFMAVGIDFEVA